MAINLLSKSSAKQKVVRPRLQDIKLVKNLRVRKASNANRAGLAHIIVAKPWGVEYLCGRNKHLEVWELYIAAQCSTSLHCHPGKDTLNIVLDGRVTLETTRGEEILQPGSCRILKAGVIHRTHNTSLGSRARVLEIESPPNKYDLIRIQDTYGRTGTGYVVPETKKKFGVGVKKNRCLLKTRKERLSQWRVRDFISTRSCRMYELELSTVLFADQPKDFLEELRSITARSIVVTDGSITLGSRGRVKKLLPGDCLFGVPTWQLRWSATAGRALIW